MVKKAGRDTTQICAAPTRNSIHLLESASFLDGMIRECKRRRYRGVTLSEMLIVLLVLGLIAAVARVNLSSVWERKTFKSTILDFVATLQMAGRTASQSGQRFEVVVNLDDRVYALYSSTVDGLDEEVTEEELIDEGSLGTALVSLEFDDEGIHEAGNMILRVGPRGWQASANIVFTHPDQQDVQYTVLLNRLNRRVELREGDVPMPEWKAPEDMLF